MQHCPRALVAPPPHRRRGARSRASRWRARRRPPTDDSSAAPDGRDRARRERRRRAGRRHDGRARRSPGSGSSVLGQLTVTVGAQSWTVPATQLGLHAYLDAAAARRRSRSGARPRSTPGAGHPGRDAHHGQRAARLRALARPAGAHRAGRCALPARQERSRRRARPVGPPARHARRDGARSPPPCSSPIAAPSRCRRRS